MSMCHRFRFSFCLLPAMIVLIGFSENVQGATYSITNLGSLGGDSVADDINNKGQIVGYSTISDVVHHAFLYSNGTMIELHDGVGFTANEAYAINDVGQIVGDATIIPNDLGLKNKAFLYDSRNGSIMLVGTVEELGDSDRTYAGGINDSGIIVGSQPLFYSSSDLYRKTPAFLTGPESGPILVPNGANPNGLTDGDAFSINKKGQVVGQYTLKNPSGGMQAFFYSFGSTVDLERLPGGGYSRANSINDSGQVVGDASDSLFSPHAVTYDTNSTTPTVPIDIHPATDPGHLPTEPAGVLDSYASHINNIGQIVGKTRPEAHSDTTRATLFVNDGNTPSMIDLNNVINNPGPSDPGHWELASATSINDFGQIVGTGWFDSICRAYLLTPGLWSTNSGGSWGNGANWGTDIPQNAGDIATLGNGVGSLSATITLDGNRTLGGLVFNKSGGYTISSGLPSSSKLIFNTNTGSQVRIGVQAGSHTIAAPVELQKNLVVNTLSGTALTISGAITEAGDAKSLSKIGTGTLTLSGTNTYTGGTVIDGGLLRFINANALPATGNVTINQDGALAAAGAYTSVSNWLASGKIAASSTGAIALTATFSADINMAGYNNLSLGSTGAYSYGGQLTPAVNTYYIGGGGGTIALTRSNGLTDNGTTARNVVVGNGGGGTVILYASNNYTGTTTINVGTLQIGTGGSSGSLGTGAIINNSLLSFYRGGSLSLANTNVISGPGRVEQKGSGTITFTAPNSYTGGTTVSAGTLMLSGGNNTLATTGPITSLGGILNLGANSQTTSGAISFQGGTVSNGTLINSGTAPYDGRSGTISANLSEVLDNPVSLSKTTTGTLTLSGTNTYTGGTEINAGTLVFSNVNSVPAVGNITINAGLACFNTTSPLPNADGSIIINANGVLQSGGTGPTVSGWLASGKIATTSTGTIAFSANSAETINMNSTPDYTSLWLGATSNITYSGSLTPSPYSNTYLLGGGAGILTVSSVLADNGSACNLTIGNGSASTVVLSGANTYTGLTQINAGTLRLSGNNRLAAASAITITGGTLDVGGYSQTNNGQISFLGGTVTNGTLNNTGYNYNAQSGMVSAKLSGTAGLDKTTSGTLILNNASSNNYAGTTTVYDGTLQIGVGGSTGSLGTGPVDIQYGTLSFYQNFSTTISNSISGSYYGILEQKGTAGFIALSGDNSSFAGTMVVNNGILLFANNNSIPTSARVVVNNGLLRFNTSTPLGMSAGTIFLNTNGKLYATGPYASVSAWLADGKIATNSTGAIALTANSNQNISMGDYSTLSLGALYSLSYTGTLTPSGDTYYIGGGGGTLTMPNLNAITGDNNLVVGNGGGGTVILSNNNNFTGSTTVSAGTLQIGIGGTTGSLGNDTAPVAMSNNSTLSFNRSDNLTMSGVITGNGSVIQQGSGKLTLSGSNTYSGGTTINGSNGTGIVSVSLDENLGDASGSLNFNGGTLQVTGTTFQSTPRSINWNDNGGGFDIVEASNIFTINQNLDRSLHQGPGLLYKQGAGTLVVNGTVDSTVMVLTGGTLRTGASSRFTGSPTVIMPSNSITLDLNGNNESFGNLQLYGGSGCTVITGSGTLTLQGSVTGIGSISGNLNLTSGTHEFAATGLTVSANISGTGGAINKTGTGILTLSGTNTYTGNTQISAGTIEFTSGLPTNGTTLLDIENGGTAIFKTTDISNIGLDIDIASGGILQTYDGTNPVAYYVGDITGYGLIDLYEDLYCTSYAATLSISKHGGHDLYLTGGLAANDELASVPEPSTLVLLAVGALAMLVYSRQRRK